MAVLCWQTFEIPAVYEAVLLSTASQRNNFQTNTSSLQRTNWKQIMGVKHLQHTLHLKRSDSDII